jgi:hypothetical protein
MGMNIQTNENTSTDSNTAVKMNGKAYFMFFLAWLIPGMGHVAQKKYVKGFVFFMGIFLLLAMGVIMEGKFYDTKQLHPLMVLGFLGDLGNGLFYFAVKFLGLGTGNIQAVTFQYGTTYMSCAGLLNYLVALNAVDIATGRRK